MKTATRARSFAWLNVTQFLGALNDNAYRWLVFFVLVSVLGDTAKESIVATSTFFFVLPFLLFSHAAGVVADRISKRTVVVVCKVLEGVVMAGGCFAVVSGEPGALYGVIFLMSTQSALFGPSKYGIIPELVGQEQLARANGMLVGATYVAIILGTFLMPFLLQYVMPQAHLAAALCCVVIAMAGTFTSLRITKTSAVESGQRFTPFFLADVVRTLRFTTRDRYLFLSLVGSAYFLFLASLIQQAVVLFGRDALGLSWYGSVYLFSFASLGIAVGSVVAGLVSGRTIEFGLVPLGALGLMFWCVVLGAMPVSLVGTVVAIVFLGLSSGFFVVPLNAFIQSRSPEGRRGEILAVSNFLNFLGVALSAGVLLLLTRYAGVSPQLCFTVAGILTLVLFLFTVAVLPDFFVRLLTVLLTRLVYRIRVQGLEHLPTEGPALLVSNHVTWVDALLISATQHRRIRFVMSRKMYEKSRMKPVFRMMGVILVAPDDPPRKIVTALKEARSALEEGYQVCIFAEGALTRNGNLRAFRPGLERIVAGTRAPIIPVYIDGAWGSMFSYHRGRLLGKWPIEVPYPVSILFGRPMPDASSRNEVRQAVIELSSEAYELHRSRDRTLPRRFVQRARRCWFRTALVDTTGKRVSFGMALVSALALRGALRPHTRKHDKVGILLPSSVGGAVANIAVTLMGKVPVNLNFTASEEALQSAMSQCKLRTVISSRAFLGAYTEFRAPEMTVYLEDLVHRVTVRKRLAAFLLAACVPSRRLLKRSDPQPDDVATIIFSSGSTGVPKGIQLTHHNILSNIEQVQTVVEFTKKDRMCSILPFFHSFGFTVTLWLPLTRGLRSVFHPNPLEGAKVAEMVQKERLTVLLSTPTFLLSYIRKAKPEAFSTLRLVMTGAEKLPERTVDAFAARFGVVPMEGYGATELSPVASINVADREIDGVSQCGVKPGSVGQPLPGVSVRIVDPDSLAPVAFGEEGLVLVNGPNVMAGYLEEPDKTAAVLREGWYNTGDMGRLDDDGFLFLTGRLSRYSKIAGEMVPHEAIEDCLVRGVESVDRVIAVVSAPDRKKGEQLVVFHTAAAGTAERLQQIISEGRVPNLWKPRKDNYVELDALPLLGSGKLDLRRLQELAAEFVENRPGFVQRMLNRLRESL